MRTATANPRALRRCLRNFNPRGPCGPRHHAGWRNRHSSLFQSSRSLRTATEYVKGCADDGIISILAVLADRDLRSMALPVQRIRFQSSRSLRTATLKHILSERRIPEFQSSRSLRTATLHEDATYSANFTFQSSRSLRTATFNFGDKLTQRIYFNPRGPCGPRQNTEAVTDKEILFQSSRSLRTATM